jgi:hypothetical protein
MADFGLASRLIQRAFYGHVHVCNEYVYALKKIFHIPCFICWDLWSSAGRLHLVAREWIGFDTQLGKLPIGSLDYSTPIRQKMQSFTASRKCYTILLSALTTITTLLLLTRLHTSTHPSLNIIFWNPTLTPLISIATLHSSSPTYSSNYATHVLHTPIIKGTDETP